MSAAEGQSVAAMTVKTLQSLRSEENFAAFWGRVYQTASELEVEYPTLPRKRRPCKRYDSGSSEGDHPGNVQDMYRRIFFEALDLFNYYITFDIYRMFHNQINHSIYLAKNLFHTDLVCGPKSFIGGAILACTSQIVLYQSSCIYL